MAEPVILECDLSLETEPPFEWGSDAEAFRSLIRASLTNPSHAQSRLVDPHVSCSYGEALAAIEAIEQGLEARGLAPGDCVTAGLTNAVDSALLALALLDGGYSVVVEPAHGHAGIAPPPAAFSRATVRMAARSEAGAPGESPAARLEIHPNAVFDSGAPAPERDHPRIYSRTSGSLGAAKIVARMYERYARNLWNSAQLLPLDPMARAALPAPIYHLFGLGTGVIASLCNGASIDLQDRPNALRFLEREREFGPNVAFVIPTFCATLVRVRRKARAYRCLITAGDLTDPATRARSESLHGPLVNMYGSSEIGTISVSAVVPHDDTNGAGHLLPGVSLRLRGDAERAHDEHPTGALDLKSRFQFAGYVDASGHALEPPGAFDGEWFVTGDRARLLPDHRLQVLGRTDLSIKRNGLLLPFADVETRLRAVAGVAEAAVVAGAPRIRGRALVAFCVLSPQAKLSPHDLQAQIAAGVPAYAVPDEVRIVSTLPMLPSGKIDRRALARSLELDAAGD